MSKVDDTEQEDRRREEILRAELEVSLGESERQETVPFNESTIEEIRREGRKQLQEERDDVDAEKLREMIRIGIEQADRGELEEVDDAITERIRTAGQEILGTKR